MKIAFIYNFVNKAIRKNIGSHINFIFSIAAITIIIAIAIMISEYANSKLQEISDEFTVAVVIKESIAETQINSIMDELLQYEIIKKVEYQEPNTSLKKFLNNYGLSEEELLFNDSFPKVIMLTLKLNYFNQNQFFNLISKLNNKKYIEEILYKEAYINNIFKIVDEFSWMLVAIVIFLFLLITIILFNSIKNIYSAFKRNYELLISLGSSKFFNFIIFIIYLLILVLIGFLISIIIISLIWYFLMFNNINYSNNFIVPTVYAIMSILIYVILINLISLLIFYRR